MLRSLLMRYRAAGAWACCWLTMAGFAAEPAAAIDRFALVSRHSPGLATVDPWAPLSVGNGKFCFTADVTGLQSFYDHYQKNGIPLETQARWAWHENPNPNWYTLGDANTAFTAYGKALQLPTNQSSPAGKWLRENPHDMPLGQLAFVEEQGGAIALNDVSGIEQTLDLWTGELRSRFKWRDELVEVSTVCHPTRDELGFRIRSPAVASGKLRVRLAFPRGHDIKTKNNPALEWFQPESHTTEILPEVGGANASPERVRFRRARDNFSCGGVLTATGAVISPPTSADPHAFKVRAKAGADTLEIAVAYSTGPGAMEPTMPWSRTRELAAAHWQKFWTSGAAIDFSGSSDPRARELERRVVLSQYLTAIQFGGDFPPQETGLTHSSWYGKHHTEMIWWHAAHFALWGRDQFLAKNLDWYIGALPMAREIARSRNLQGARWPKMIGPDGRESPGGNPLIVWNQPHPIHLAELMYRNAPTAETLARYRDLVSETAAGMASMLNWDEAKQRFNLGPPLWIAQEIYEPATSMNPAYELSYWIRGMTIAQQWRERLKLPRDVEWDRRIKLIAKLPQKDGKYVAIESTPDTWDNKDSRHDHPSFLMALGQLPGDGVDRAVMGRTLDAVLKSWDWETKIWGWDYPMVAMTAARLGEPKKAIDILLYTRGPNNAYMANGHCPQRGDLPVYLPANGALLAAVAMMARGWDNGPTADAPGFPNDGTWVVRSEGLKPLP
jgi:hypothetical protein